MRIKWRSMALVGGLLFAVALPSQLSAQSFQGQISGVIEDEQGASVPGATATLRNENTGETRTQVSTRTGTVVFPNLLVGSYTLTVELTGFKKYERPDILVSQHQRGRQGPPRRRRGMEDVITVVGGAELVKTTSSQLEGGSFDAKTIRDLPIMQGGAPDGDPANFAVLAAGVGTMPGGMAGRAASSAATVPARTTSSWTASTTTTGRQRRTLVPHPGLGAEFSAPHQPVHRGVRPLHRGQFVTTTKSGTNHFKGGVWGYHINRHLQLARQPHPGHAVDDPDFEKPRYDRQRVGAQFGGPFVKDKWFFYGAYEYRNLNAAGSPRADPRADRRGPGPLQGLAGRSGSGVSPLNVGILRDFVPPAATSPSPASTSSTRAPASSCRSRWARSRPHPELPAEHLGHFTSTDYQMGQHRFSARRFHYYRPVRSRRASCRRRSSTPSPPPTPSAAR